MISDIILKALIAICIAGLFTDLLVIFAKLFFFRCKAIAGEKATINLKGNLWVAYFTALIIVSYFLTF